MNRVFKKVCCCLIAVMLIFPMAGIQAQGLSVTASAAIAMDYETGEILYAKDIDTMRVPASMTKIMTAYIIFEELEKGTLTKETPITVTADAARLSRNSSYPAMVPLTEGSTMTVDHALKLIMLPSASATCYLMAEHISGSEEAFTARMNETAKTMGIKAEYKNSHGAHPHYTTAWSTAELIRQFIKKYPDILNYTSMKSVAHNGTTYTNTNMLLNSYYYEGADGFKTGTIPEAGYCLSATAVKDGKRIITVVMNSSSTQARHTDSQALLDYGFEELARRDASRAATQLEFSKLPDELRMNSDHKLSVKFTGVTTDYQASGKILHNGEVIGETGPFTVSNNMELNINYYLPLGYTEAAASAGFNLVMPDGSEKELAKELTVSSKEAAIYRDINSHWAEEAMAALSKAEIFSGDGSGYFKPEGEMSRAMFISVLGRSAEKAGISIEPRQEAPFSDVSAGRWYSKYVAWAAEIGLVEGYDGKFLPDDTINREQLASILFRFSEIYDIELASGTSASFTDMGSVSSWASESAAAMIKAGILSGYEDGTFQPGRTANRGETARILYLYFLQSPDLSDILQETGDDDIQGEDGEDGEDGENGSVEGQDDGGNEDDSTESDADSDKTAA